MKIYWTEDGYKYLKIPTSEDTNVGGNMVVDETPAFTETWTDNFLWKVELGETTLVFTNDDGGNEMKLEDAFKTSATGEYHIALNSFSQPACYQVIYTIPKFGK